MNLWNGRADAGAVEELLRELDPDVVGVQELGADQADAIAAVMPHGILEPATDYSGMGIALRHPASFDRVPLKYRDMRVARLSPDAWPDLPAAVEFATVHISAPHVMPYPIGIWHRWHQTDGVLDYLASVPAERRVLVGDFNATPAWPVYRRIASQLTDAAVAVAQVRGRSVAPTWGPGARARRMLRIDHGFVHGLRPEEFQVLEVTGSDHSAIVMDLSFDSVGAVDSIDS